MADKACVKRLQKEFQALCRVCQFKFDLFNELLVYCFSSSENNYAQKSKLKLHFLDHLFLLYQLHFSMIIVMLVHITCRVS